MDRKNVHRRASGRTGCASGRTGGTRVVRTRAVEQVLHHLRIRGIVLPDPDGTGGWHHHLGTRVDRDDRVSGFSASRAQSSDRIAVRADDDAARVLHHTNELVVGPAISDGRTAGSVSRIQRWGAITLIARLPVRDLCMILKIV